jgi:asparagine synthase (glutamine-hydrolysing)
VLERKKKGFGAPVSEWMLDRMGSFVEEALLNSPLRRRELFDYGFIKQLLDEHRSGRVDYGFFLWSLLNLSLWYERWIDGAAHGSACENAGHVSASSLGSTSRLPV